MREIDAMNAAYEKYPDLKPYHEILRKLCFKDVAGLDVKEDFREVTHETGVPWTFILMHHLKTLSPQLPDKVVCDIPMFIIEVQKQLHKDRDYSQTFSDDPDVIFLQKQRIDYSTTSFYTTYHFIVRNKALAIVLKDYGDHIYLNVEGCHDDLELGGSEAWTEEKSQRNRATYDAWHSVQNPRGGGHWNGKSCSRSFCRGTIDKDIADAKKLLAAIKPFISNDISLRNQTYALQKLNFNIMPELS